LSRTSIGDLLEEVVLRRVPFLDSPHRLLNNNKERAGKSFILLLKDALENFERAYPLERDYEIEVESEEYEFKDNYEDHLANKVPETGIILVPLEIFDIRLSGRRQGGFHYSYTAPVLRTKYNGSNVKVRAFHRYPIHYEFTADGDFTTNSHVFGMKKKEYFDKYLDYYVLRQAQFNQELIQLPVAGNFLNFSTLVSSLETEVQDLENTSSAFYKKWEY
jgi:hypothetical protein